MSERKTETRSTWATLPYRALLILMALVITVSALPLSALGQETPSADEETPAIGSEIIVVLEDGEDPRASAAAMGVEVKHIYRHVFTGFAGTVTGEAPVTAAAARARRAPKKISEDGDVRIEAQIIPTGISRAGMPHQPGATNLDIPSPVDADVAILDTGIADLPDLNVAGGVSCVGGNPDAWQDDNGHGTHVAGITAAEDNDAGVVGVAPGARLWAVKVLDSGGGGSFSDVICGLDWVAGSAATIDVANLSLSGEGKPGNCSDQALHTAICAVVNAGVSVVVAAGNQSTNADNRVPASFPEVITVSGITDSDGQPGGLGPKPCFGDRDDVFLNFTNFGPSVDIAAPGGCIVSYNPGGGLESASGTSEASPHVAGAAAFFIAGQGSRPSPDQVRSWLLNQASRPQSTDGVGGDPDAGQSQASKKQIKKLKQKIKKSKGKKGGKKHKKNKKGKGKKNSQSQSKATATADSKQKKLKKKLKALKSQEVQDGHLEPVLWLAGLG